ncbi:DUF4394 domain-containing protein [Spirosoma montaniterrae]|uniref:DUF4394 domain-containing protein n=1 Tax=Spirosoma montaniterrae TaxID=1178516 RepID=A0A1P9X3G1_9BACT|nr:DUF4394 domain-containing protein [Spirosoma montaniterrae]AQG82164.1 hypothetical protein AWR27_24435 [Spirosoma montaniterrae]
MRVLKNLRPVAALLAIGSLLMLNACKEEQLIDSRAELGAAQARLSANFTFYALTDNNQLLLLNSQNPTSALATTTITGLASGERLQSIDFRPATGQLYGVSDGSRLYTINPNTGAARMVGMGPFMPPVAGDVVSIDFNPTVDRLRLVTNRGQNLRLNPETGTVMVVDGSINGPAPVAINGVAYTNNRAGVTSTILYDIDPLTDKLYRQDPPNAGGLAEVGSLGIDIAGRGSFDIAPDGSAVAILISGTTQGFYQIDLMSGRAERLSDLPNLSLIGIAIPTEPVAYTVDGLNNLLIFNPLNPNPISKTITGLQNGETIFGIDFRPANGQLYALGSTNRLYTINTSNGAAAPVGSGPFAASLSGNDRGFDFNPMVDRIRLVTNSGQNLRLNPNDGTVTAVDGNLNPGSPNVTAAAYTNNFAGTTSTVLFDIDTRTENAMLMRQDPPNAGGLVAVGSLGIPIEGGNGFDIGGTSNSAYALLRSGGTTRIYSINLTTGQASNGIALPGNPTVRGFALGLGF